MKKTVKDNKENTINKIKACASKEKFNCSFDGDRLYLSEKNELGHQPEAIPTFFKGKVKEEGRETVITGHIEHGFYLTAMLFAAVLSEKKAVSKEKN